MHLLIVGANGQLGRAVAEVYAAREDVRVTVWGGRDHDITQPGIGAEVALLRPDVVINCAAWTQVDAAESHADAAFAVNSLGPWLSGAGLCRVWRDDGAGQHQRGVRRTARRRLLRI